MATIVTRAGKGSPLTNTEVDANFTNLNADKAELSGAAFTGAITTNSTVDGVDIATRDGVLSSTTTTAGAALPKAGGAMTGAITTNSTVDGRDVATDGTKLDTVETNADVTDATNVTAAGALMDSEVTNLAQVKSFDSSDYATAAQGTTANAALPKAGGAMTGAITTNSTFDGRDVATDGTKLDGIEASADVTDATNVTAAGALMDSELTAIASVKALNQGVATTDDPTFTNTQLAAIAQSKSDTATDVFVYDTSKDSDGGAWRNRTQNTSWYNEALNTSTRGANKKFPSVAVIVAEDDVVTIYDGDAPDMPMWMVFSAGSYTFMAPTTRQTTCVAMLNGILCIGRRLSAGFLAYTSFVDDTARAYSGNVNEYRDWLKPISDRNTTTALEKSNSAYAIVNDQINDVAMTVLPNAPIDADTGLPVPTIAVATDGGTSIIKDDGTVGTLTAFSPVTGVTINSTTLALYSNSSSTGYLAVGSSTVATGSAEYSAGWRTNWSYEDNISSTPTALLGETATFGALGTSNEIHAAGNDGYNIFLPSVGETQDAIAYITPDYNTGYMVGDIKLATLSDTDTTNAVGTELVTNGDFATDSDWNKGTGWTISGGKANHAQASGGGELYQEFSIVAGNTYVMSFTLDTTGDTLLSNISIGFRTTGGSYLASIVHSSIDANTAGQKFAITYTATSSITVRARIYADDSVSIDDWSVRLAEEDRSVNGNGLQVFGTVTKSAVATGADLVAYSGFNGNNYFRQPYNADLQFGTGSFSVMGWYKVSTVSGGYRCLVYINTVGVGSLGNDNHGFQILIDNNEQLYSYVYGPATDADCITSGVATDGAWHMFCHVTQDQSNHALYIDGVKRASSTDTTGNINNTDAQLMVGAYGGVTDGNAFPFTDGSLANIRISATAPTVEQIAKMYNDEKHLFQENAQATLYGSSDAVTALAYDDDTELLHAGTSAGRSVFQGLRRVSNTTDAVGAAISASNDLVVEE